MEKLLKEMNGPTFAEFGPAPAGKPRRVAELSGVFGYLRLPRSGVSSEQFDAYQGHFCAVCHSLDGWGGKLASLLTNYDVTFWLLTLTALQPVTLERRRCTALPFRQVPVMALSPQSRLLVAAVTLALAGAKVEDDRHDGDRPWVRWAFLPLHSSWERARRHLDAAGFPRDAVEGLGSWQRALEARADVSLEELTQPTQSLLAAVFGFLADHCARPELRDSLEELGRGLGSYIYLWDAWTDRARDGARGSFNALLRPGIDPEQVAYRLLHSLAHVQRALDKLPLGEQRPLLSAQVARLRTLVRQDLPAPLAPTGAGCWIMGGALALSLQPQAAVACDSGCDCGGCDGCSGCDCSGLDSCANCGDACNCGDTCNNCSCSGSDVDCCCNCCSSGNPCDVCVVCSPSGGNNPKKVATPPPAEPEEAIPGVRRDAKTGWQKPEKPAPEGGPEDLEFEAPIEPRP
jgi:hypothetical protein